MKPISILLLILLFSCNSHQRNPVMNFPKGGYKFAEKVGITDSSFPFYPVRSMEAIMDSTYDAYYTRKLLEAFDEPNISLRPAAKPVFRIIFSEWKSPSYFIRIDEDQVVIKKGQRVDYLHKDEEKLSELERDHLNLLERGVPLTRRMKEAASLERRYLDSLTKVYPVLLTEEYYNYLMQKAFTPLDKPFTYSSTTNSLWKSEFDDIVNKLKAAGYWTLPMDVDCHYRPTDGYQFILECNSGLSYNIVKFGACDDEPTPLRMVCKEIIELAGLSKEIQL